MKRIITWKRESEAETKEQHQLRRRGPIEEESRRGKSRVRVLEKGINDLSLNLGVTIEK